MTEEKFEYDKTETYETDHYVFHYQKGCFAEKNIRTIAKTQEEAFSEICKTLRVVYPEQINYYFTDSPRSIGRAVWEEETDCNGVALCGRNKIYAVYTENLKCIGAHEDTHLISWLINYPESDFIIEGLAMSFDKLWWGVPNEAWTAYYKAKRPDLSIKDLFDNDIFDVTGCDIAYPIAGAFSKFLIDTFGIERYLSFYKYEGDEYDEAVHTIFGTTFLELETLFWNHMKSITYDAPTLEKLLKEEGCVAP